jgi:hypothetical protein
MDRKEELLKEMVSGGKHIIKEWPNNVERAVKLAIFNTLVILDGEALIHGAEVRPYVELPDETFATLEDIAGNLHYDFCQLWVAESLNADASSDSEIDE